MDHYKNPVEKLATFVYRAASLLKFISTIYVKSKIRKRVSYVNWHSKKKIFLSEFLK